MTRAALLNLVFSYCMRTVREADACGSLLSVVVHVAKAAARNIA